MIEGAGFTIPNRPDHAYEVHRTSYPGPRVPGGELGGTRGSHFLSSGQLTTKWSYVSVPPTYLQCVNKNNLDYTEFIANVKLSIKLKILCN